MIGGAARSACVLVSFISRPGACVSPARWGEELATKFLFYFIFFWKRIFHNSMRQTYYKSYDYEWERPFSIWNGLFTQRRNLAGNIAKRSGAGLLISSIVSFFLGRVPTHFLDSSWIGSDRSRGMWTGKEKEKERKEWSISFSRFISLLITSLPKNYYIAFTKK